MTRSRAKFASRGFGGGKFLAQCQQLAFSLGLDSRPVLKEMGIGRRHLEDPDRVLPQHAVNEMMENAALSFGIEDLGLQRAELNPTSLAQGT